MAVIKRFLNNVAGAATVGIGWAAGKRAGNDAYDWVKSGEAGEAIERLGQKTIAAAKVAKDKLVDASGGAGDALKKGVREVRARLDAGDEERPERDAEAREAAAEEELSEDDRAAARARQRAAASGVEVRCTHCEARVSVPADAELARCTSCNQRFWIERD
jgi:hypothetical protein